MLQWMQIVKALATLMLTKQDQPKLWAAVHNLINRNTIADDNNNDMSRIEPHFYYYIINNGKFL